MNTEKPLNPRPDILAPAGSKASFLAAVAAGADAIYCGLKQFSARMEAKNFTLEELASLTRLAHEKGTKVYVAINTLLKPADLDPAGSILRELSRTVKPDALILQDLSVVQLVRQTGFTGRLILSTLANVSFPMALSLVKKQLGVDRVVVPRELDIDEIKTMAAACPEGLSLEVFVHGALCYGVSGRCYWSSYFGGKSGLRGRCVQPCRRMYSQKKQTNRLFSCMDLSMDVLAKVLLSIPQVEGWKIEGRKKGPHYVYYTVKAYQLLRDHGGDSQAKKSALGLLSMALGRKGTHFNFLPQRPQTPVHSEGKTGSGLYLGKIQGDRHRPYLIPMDELLSGDVLRLGYEDEPGHGIYRIHRSVPKKGRLYLKPSTQKKPQKGTSVFLIDRREKELDDMISQLEADMAAPVNKSTSPSSFKVRLPKRHVPKKSIVDLKIYRDFSEEHVRRNQGYWLSPEIGKRMTPKIARRTWWSLPPVIWPKEESELRKNVKIVLDKGSRNFILNAPWQVTFFQNPKAMNLWAGPFCNLSNPPAINTMSKLGFSGVILSPELGRDDYLALPKQCSLPLGVVISGNWPLCVSRIQPDEVETELLFTSPKMEQAWVMKFGHNFWIFPNWKLDIEPKKKTLQNAGYKLFLNLYETLPSGIKMKKRPGLWNWDLGLR